MGEYVESNLNRGEKLVMEAKRSKWLLVGVWIKACLFFWVFLIPVVKAIIITIKYHMVELAFTDKRVIGKAGVISTVSMDTSLNKIQNVQVSRNLWGRLFGYGKINISSASVSDDFNIDGIKNAEAFKQALMAQIEQCEQDRIQEQASQMASAMSAALNQNKQA